MTTKKHGTIIYYNEQSGMILRAVTADDVAALEHQAAELRHDLAYYMYGAGQDAAKIASLEAHIDLLNAEVTRLQAQYDETEQMRGKNYARAMCLEQAYRVASAIMRAQPVGVPPRLVAAWRAAVQAIGTTQEA